ncbi:MAG: hypothetical protein J0H65_05845 [Rhizobiales bacterium]|nr:hypothetical protein [Hyphomicrobiales bacterium]
MSLDAIFTVIGGIVTADGLSYAIVAALALAAFVLMHATLPVKGLAYIFAPVLAWSGLAGIYTASALGMVFSTEKAVDAAVAATVGMVAALLVMVLLKRLVDAVLRIRTPLGARVPLDRRLRI